MLFLCDKCPNGGDGYSRTRDGCLECMPLPVMLALAVVVLAVVGVSVYVLRRHRTGMSGFRVLARGMQAFTFVALLGSARWPAFFVRVYTGLLDWTGGRMAVIVLECHAGWRWTSERSEELHNDYD